MDPSQFVRGFRESSPYIHRFRGQTFVIAFEGNVLADGSFPSIASDIALLKSLGVGIVLVCGAGPQISEALSREGIELSVTGQGPVVTSEALRIISRAIGGVRFEVEAALSRGVIGSPMSGSEVKVVSGNFLMARPLGVIDGVDHHFYGKPREVRVDAIRSQIGEGQVVLLSSLGGSLSGDLFLLSPEDVAQSAAVSLGASKLIFLIDEDGVPDRKGGVCRELTDREAQSLLVSGEPLQPVLRELLRRAVGTVTSGVDRVHLVNRFRDGALLLELFTRDGLGTLVSSDPFEAIRSATIEDVSGILDLIRPLETMGILVGRSRDAIETDIGLFAVTHRDGKIIGCAALYPFPEQGMGEVACLAIHPEYRNAGRAADLLSWFEKKARTAGLNRLFVLSTQAEHWFVDRGFVSGTISELPPGRRELYSHHRKSLILYKSLKE
ncbi:MAG: amino-acid N-acetyltransferase [Leptospirales bacterium]